MSASIDLNADLGESFGPWRMGDDDGILDVVSSANIACGFHAGDPVVMTETVKKAKDKGVSIGAHPGFDDLRGFGRRRIIGMSDAELWALTIAQIGALSGVCQGLGTRVHHVKLHGALSNMASENVDMARACLKAVYDFDPTLPIVAMAATALETAALELQLPIAREVFADRAYNDDGTLVARHLSGAVLHNPNDIAERVLKMIDEQAVTSVNDKKISVMPQTICVHGDTPGSVAIAAALRQRLESEGIRVERFTTSQP